MGTIIVGAFVDDMGNLVFPYKLENFISRYNLFKGNRE